MTGGRSLRRGGKGRFCEKPLGDVASPGQASRRSEVWEAGTQPGVPELLGRVMEPFEGEKSL